VKATFDPQNPAIESSPPHLETSRLRIKNVLLATDFSASAHAGLRAAVALAQQFDSTLFILHAVPPPVTFAGEFGVLDPTVLEAHATAAKARMDALTKDPALQFVNHRTILTSASIIDSIDAAVTEHKIDLLVMGTHGAKGLEKLALGSVAEAVLRRSQCPVMVVGPHSAPYGFRFASVLLATDLGAASLRPAQYAVAIAEEVAGQIALLHVAEQPPQKSRRAFEAKIAGQLRQLLPGDAELWCTPNVRVQFGDPGTEILRAARLDCANLIVMGVRTGAFLADHAPWSTVSKVIRGATCPVLAVRAHLT
jgi:nucleotide-binding universal stress UspA family protein